MKTYEEDKAFIVDWFKTRRERADHKRGAILEDKIEERVNIEQENERLRALLTRMRRAGDNIYIQLSYFMESDNCENEPGITWPDTCEDGCVHCSCEADMADWQAVVEAVPF